jgi:hypothetical protein
LVTAAAAARLSGRGWGQIAVSVGVVVAVPGVFGVDGFGGSRDAPLSDGCRRRRLGVRVPGYVPGVLTLLFLLFMLLLMASVVGAARRRRRALEAQEEAARHAAGGDVHGTDGAAPFEIFPFGGLLEALMGTDGARSFRYDPETGEWVEMSEDVPPSAETVAPGGGTTDAPARRPPRPARVQPRSASPFGDLMGSLGAMGGSGQFEVEGPEELSTFEDVGGMEELKQEVRETVGLMLEHPGDAERYGIEWNGILLHGPPGVGKTFI